MDFYKQWCKSTKRNGGILVGSSIKELLIAHKESIPSTGLQKEVTGCKGCPLFNSDDKYAESCNHPQFEVYIQDIPFEFYKENGKSPDWCPLKKEPITISFKQQDNAKDI